MYELPSDVVDEVVDLDDQRVLDLGEVLLLGHRGTRVHRGRRVEQALQHDPPVVHVAIAGQVDPAHPTVREAADHLVLATEHIAGVQLGIEIETRTARRAEALGATRLPIARASDRRVA
jgi:hypothetical protein